MSKQALKLLKDKNPDQRKQAIRALAKSKNRDAVKELLKMAKGDKDASVRQLAGQAAVHIEKAYGALPSQQKSGGVTDKDKIKAMQALKDAQTFLDRDDRNKASQLVQRALKLDPGLKNDSYLISLAEVITGAEGEASVEKLGDQKLFQDISSKKETAAREKEDADHLEMVMKTGWKEVTLDLSMLFVVALLGTMLAFFLVKYSAQAYQDKWDKNQTDLAEAEGKGWCDWDENDKYICGRDGNPLNERSDNSISKFSPLEPSPEFWRTMIDWKEAEVSRIVMPGVVVGFGSLVGVFLAGLLIHLLSGIVFRGQGGLPHTIHGVAVAVLSRGVLLVIIAVIGIIVGFSMGGTDLILYLFLGLAGLIVLLMVLAIISSVAKAYKQNFALALFSSVIGFAPIGAAVFFGLMELGAFKL